MAKIKYFRTLPENQKYLYKNFASVSKAEGTLCDECGTYIQNIVQVVGSVDHITYNLGLTCCEKQAKMDKGLDLDDKVAMKVKFWKSRLQKLSKFRKAFDKARKENTIAIEGWFYYNIKEQQAKIDFGFLYDDGEWWIMHEDFPITKIYDKVKETFKDVWDQIDWMGMDACAKMETSAEVYQAVKDGTVKGGDWNKWNETHYPEWDQKSEIRRAIEIAAKDANYDYGEGKSVKLPEWFNPFDYPEGMFDEVVNSIKDAWWCRSEDLVATDFVVTNKEALKRQEMGDAYVPTKTRDERVAELAKMYNDHQLTMDEFMERVMTVNAEYNN